MALATANLLPRAPDMISRRGFLLAGSVAVLLPRKLMANEGRQGMIDWAEFKTQMSLLADANANQRLDRKHLADRGLQYLSQLDISSAEYKQAVDDSYETGNRYWLWQRMIKQQNLNGGILTIDDSKMVQLHDHPGATGMVRITSGEAEVWLFDENRGSKAKPGLVELTRVSRRILRSGDTAILTPETGNIHALRAISKECSMLDFFIPPYVKSQRSWFEPLDEDWFAKERFTCRKVPQHAYNKA